MRYILLVILVLISFGTSAQAPPMSIGGPQGINVKRILAQDWMSVPIMADTPVAPLTGSGWPGRGYVVFVAQNPDSICAGCPPADTSLWEYTGQRWKRVGMDYLTKLVFGGEVTQSNTFSRRFFVGSYGAFINGSYYTKVPFTTLTTSPKVADSTSRIDAIVLTPLGPSIKVGVARQVPLKPSISSDEIELSTIYFPPFDTVPRFIPVATGVTSVFRVPGKDSIFYSIDTTTFAIKDSIGISVATNGLTASDKTIKLGGSLTENTNINLSSRRLNVLSGSDTTRFFANGSISIGSTPSDSTYRFNVNGGAKMDSLIVDSLYAKFGRTLASGVPVAPIEFRIASSKTRIDLRPAGAGGWNNNWYGAITHTASETDVLSSPYGSLYLGTTNYFGSSGIYLGNTRNNPSMYIRNNNNILVGDTANTGFRFDVNGIARVRDTLTLSTTPATSDTTANDLLVINSSNGQVRRYTGAWPVPSITALNGLTRSNDTIRLGGTLNQNTTINGSTNGLTFSNLGSFFANTSIAYIGNSSGEGVGVLNGRARVQKLSGTTSIGLYVSDSVFLQSYNGITEVTSPIQSYTTDTSKFKILTINNTTGSLAVYTGAWPSAPLSGSATLDFPSTNNGNESDLTITVTGASEGDVVSLGIPNSVNLNHSCFTAWVSADNTVTVRFNNYGTGALNPVSATFKVKVFK